MDQPSILHILQPFIEGMEKRLVDQMAGLEQRLLQRMDGMDAHMEDLRLQVKDLDDHVEAYVYDARHEQD